MAARDPREHEKDSYLSNFSVDYKKAFIKQQKEPIPDVSEGKLDEYIKSKFNICDQYYNDKWNHTSYPLFLHREYTYGGYGMSGMGAKCYKCKNETDYDYQAHHYGNTDPAEKVPRHDGEGDTPMTPENYERYDEILEEEQRKREEEQRRQEEQQRMMEEDLRRRQQEARERLQEEEKRKKREEDRIKNIPKIKEETLRRGYCPITFETVDEMVVSKLCGHGISKEGREGMLEQPYNKYTCPLCKQENAFSKGNTETHYTSQGKEKRRARIIELCKKGVLTAGACAAAAVAAPYFTGGKKTRRRKHKKSAKTNKTKRARTKRARTKVKKDRKNKTKRK